MNKLSTAVIPATVLGDRSGSSTIKIKLTNKMAALFVLKEGFQLIAGILTFRKNDAIVLFCGGYKAIEISFISYCLLRESELLSYTLARLAYLTKLTAGNYNSIFVYNTDGTAEYALHLVNDSLEQTVGHIISPFNYKEYVLFILYYILYHFLAFFNSFLKKSFKFTKKNVFFL